MITKKRNNILITGASGFIGKALVKRLLRNGGNLFLVSRNLKFKEKGTKIFRGDLHDKSFCGKIVKNIDTVYYLAAFKKNISIHTKEPFDVVLGNTLPLLNFLGSVKGSKIKSIVYVSSTLVEYALSQNERIDGYVLGKYINEQIIRSFVVQTGIPIKIVRSAPVYGPGDNFDKETANFIPTMINKVDSSKDRIDVWGTGKRKLQYIFVEDLVSNLVAASKDKTKDLFMVGNPEVLNINKIALKIIKIFSKKIMIKNDITKPDKPSLLFEFNNLVVPKFSFNRGLQKTIDYYKNYYKK